VFWAFYVFKSITDDTMATKPMLVLGLMSGTSADGIDVALARISGAPPHLRAKLLEHTSSRFPAALRKEILRVAEQHSITAGELSQLNFRLGEVFAEAALAACRIFRVSPKRIALVGSHGQTVFHQGKPARYFGQRTASTLQIGEPSVIAARTGITTVGDFRPADVALGGQGAPLVPYADYLLYRHEKLGRISLNLGGIANITVIPASAKPEQTLAFDTGPANMLIDALVAHFTHDRQRYDKNAQRAMKGRDIAPLFSVLLKEPYLYEPPPKSTGREYFGNDYVDKFLQLGRKYQAKPNDLIHAATWFTLVSVRLAIELFVLPKTKVQQLIVSGGGANNPLIYSILSEFYRHNGIAVMKSSHFGIPVDAKEAFAFAILAYETLHGRPANLPSATGAHGPAILGKISYAPPR
jgi:anhydro-N-acetylmuramic acid kinase